MKSRIFLLEGLILSLADLNTKNCEKWSLASGIIKSRLSLIVRVNVVLNRTVVVDRTDISSTCTVVIFRVKVSCITSVDGIILWLLI